MIVKLFLAAGLTLLGWWLLTDEDAPVEPEAEGPARSTDGAGG